MPGWRCALAARAHRGRRRPGAERGPLAADHLAQPRHAAPGAQRGLSVAARADHAAAAHAPARAGCAGGGHAAAGAERAVETIERALAEEGPLTRRAAARAARLRRRATAGQALDPPALPRRRCAGSPCAGRWPARNTPTSSTRDWLGPQPSRSTATRPSPSWPAATWSATARPTTATSPAGRGCRCATRAPAWPRSPRSWSSARTACVDLAKRPPAAELPPPRLLGAFDPLLLGWTSREEIVGPHKHAGDDERHLPPLRPGRRAAPSRPGGSTGGKVTIEQLGKVTKKAAAALEADARAVEEFHAASTMKGEAHGTASGPFRGRRQGRREAARATTPRCSIGRSTTTTR